MKSAVEILNELKTGSHLLKEIEEAAAQKAADAVKLGDNKFEIMLWLERAHDSFSNNVSINFMLNGKRIVTRVPFSLIDKHASGRDSTFERLTKALGEAIAREALSEIEDQMAKNDEVRGLLAGLYQ